MKKPNADPEESAMYNDAPFEGTYEWSQVHLGLVRGRF